MTNDKRIQLLAVALVAAMALLQLYFAISAYLDPTAFAASRGTPLRDSNDSDWVRVYASRTLFIVLILGMLTQRRQYALLAWAALAGTVMPVTDFVLALLDRAAFSYQFRHLATLAYLLLAFGVLHRAAKIESRPKSP